MIKIKKAHGTTILIQRLPSDEYEKTADGLVKTKSGLLLAGQTADDYLDTCEGLVLEIGEQVTRDILPGDILLFPKYSAANIFDKYGKDLACVFQRDVYLTLERVNEEVA